VLFFVEGLNSRLTKDS